MSEIIPIHTAKDLTIPALSKLSAKIDLKLKSKPYFKECSIEAANDLEAVECWLNKHIDNSKTYAIYQRQAKLFLMWCSYECGKTIAQLKVQDYEVYFKFLRLPPKLWCATRAELRKGRHSTAWRPLVNGLSESAIRTNFRILQSLMRYLSDSHYIHSNPLKLIKLSDNQAQAYEEQKYQVWARMLEEDEWKAVQEILENLPEETSAQLGYKLKIQFLVALLYFCGLRIHEVATHTWRAFQYREGNWWFFVKGKGDKLGHIPVHDKLLSLAKLYRMYLKKTPLPDLNDEEPLFISLNQQPLKIRQLYNMVKKIGALASTQFTNQPAKAMKLKRLSPHWLRHLCASHQDKAGISATMIRENLRHGSSQTTQIYLHAEEKLRHEAMQKMSFTVKSNLRLKKMITSQTLFFIRLSKGPAHKSLGFKKFLEVLEEEIFATYQWSPYQFDKLKKIEEIETSIIPIKNIEFAYIFDDLSQNQFEILKKAIGLEASIRLFKVEIEGRLEGENIN